MRVKQKPTLLDNIFIHFRLPKLVRGISKDLRLVRELWCYLRPGYYRLSSDGSLVDGKALDLPVHNFVVDGEANVGVITQYIKTSSVIRNSDVTIEPTSLLSEVSVIPVVFSDSRNWREGDFGLVCCTGFPTHLVRIDEECLEMRIHRSAQAAVKLLMNYH